MVPAGTFAAKEVNDVVATAKPAPNSSAWVILFLYMHKLQVLVLHP
ncbi:Uncharacterised protein [Vibrio cholerae]|uniref:Uncharacterized protein n=1 Tax=Vibrio cholerae TaxID=666 RepID=A0A655U800_VIBCL|nr:Uncharacterised protein [Vibrio cholerae]CSA59059.1 Uncharacterised protein [Vibrio cholerae]CSB20254.1 Uncharacterised protein [Vibrio cholerae]CSB46414.1 Uncharacterised protein [Vibrio cholerae]CSB51569.1 Uncharacterised protein [Vibrio cholerae]